MSPARPVGIAVVGTGNISPEYLRNLTAYPDLDVRWVVGRDLQRAAERAAEFGVQRSGPLEMALADPEVEIVVNLAVPAAHVEIGMAALRAGKHVWSEKPIATDLSGARALLTVADEAGLRIAVAPDTTLGPVVQAALAAIDGGALGIPLVASAGFRAPGPEAWHPDPAFLYDVGGGPLLDIGPYFVAALVETLGSIAKVTGTALRSSETRTVASGPLAGTDFPVRVPTTVLATLTFVSGAIAEVHFSFDAVGPFEAELDITGTEGRLRVAGADVFGGGLQLQRRGDTEPVPVPSPTPEFRRGYGVLDLARSLRAGVPERTSALLALHVLEVLEAIAVSAEKRTTVSIDSSAPDAIPLGPEWNPMEVTIA